MHMYLYSECTNKLSRQAMKNCFSKRDFLFFRENYKLRGRKVYESGVFVVVDKLWCFTVSERFASSMICMS